MNIFTSIVYLYIFMYIYYHCNETVYLEKFQTNLDMYVEAATTAYQAFH